VQLELVVDEADAVHRLDRCPDRLSEAAQANSESPQANPRRVARPDLERLAALIE
jgi:hypothetical protein